MYASRYGLRSRPFRSTPDTDAYYPATTHEVAIAGVRRAIDDDEGLVVLTGEAGTGKTLLAQRVLEELHAVRFAIVTPTAFTHTSDLLQAILFDLGLAYDYSTEQEARLALTQACLNQFQQGGKSLLVVDDAHLLGEPELEELRRLSDLAGKHGRAVQVLLLGLPSLLERLKQPGMTAFRQRVATRVVIDSLTPEESIDYLMHQVRRVGGRPETLFGSDVLDILCHASLGIPRLLNQSAHLAFSLADEAEADGVDAEAAVEAVTRLGLDTNEHEEIPQPPSHSTPVLTQSVVQRVDAPSLVPVGPHLQQIVGIREDTCDGPPTYIYGDDVAMQPEGQLPVPQTNVPPYPQWGSAKKAG